MIRRAGLVLAAALVGAFPGPSRAQDIRLPEGAVLSHAATVPEARFGLPVGPFDPGAGVAIRTLAGRLDHTVWQLEPPPTVAVLLATVEAEVLAAGYEILLACDARACGGFDFRLAIPDLGAPVMMVDLGRYGYVAAAQPETGAYLMALVSETRDLAYVQITRIQPEDLARPGPGTATAAVAPTPAPGTPVPPSDAGFAAQMAAAGAVVLEDLEFATGSAELARTPFESLRALAAFLADDPGRSVVLVGHSDAQGAADVNLALSLRRAEAVRARLIAEFGVDAARLGAEGVGSLVPRAGNGTEAGRRANRRVEAVLLQP